jgi:hypothetical protein
MGITYSQGIDVDAALKTFLDTFGPYLFKFIPTLASMVAGSLIGK